MSSMKGSGERLADCGAEPALEIAQDLITEVNGKVLTAEQVAALIVLAKVLTK